VVVGAAIIGTLDVSNPKSLSDFVITSCSWYVPGQMNIVGAPAANVIAEPIVLNPGAAQEPPEVPVPVGEGATKRMFACAWVSWTIAIAEKKAEEASRIVIANDAVPIFFILRSAPWRALLKR